MRSYVMRIKFFFSIILITHIWEVITNNPSESTSAYINPIIIVYDDDLTSEQKNTFLDSSIIIALQALKLFFPSRERMSERKIF